MLQRIVRSSSLIRQGRAFAGPAGTTCSNSLLNQVRIFRNVCTKSQHYFGLSAPVWSNNHLVKFIHTSKGPLCDSSNPTSAPTTPQTDWKKLTNEDWAKRLSPEAYFCARENGTEAPFTGQYVNHKAEGVYRCVCCGSDLFTSKTKYDSGSGWPSFHSAIEEAAIIRRKDVSHGMVRTEILCASCNCHLGHVFDDGPEPSNERFCVNSVCLKFAPKKLS